MKNKKEVKQSLNFLICEKKGISGIITVLLILAITIISAGVVWYTIQNVLSSQTSELQTSSNCLGITLDIVSVGACPAGSTSCNVTVERRAGGGDINGVRVIITDGSSTLIGDGNAMSALEMATITATGSALGSDATKAKVAALIADSSGENYVCEIVDEYLY